MCRKKDTQKNSSMVQGVKMQRKGATRIAYKACFKGLVESHMDMALDQGRRNENVINRTQ
jgi:hypothetical protein